jgi:hypothetical protein
MDRSPAAGAVQDIRLARQTGAELATLLPSAAVADCVLTKAEELGYADRDTAGLHDLLARLSSDGVPLPDDMPSRIAMNG